MKGATSMCVVLFLGAIITTSFAASKYQRPGSPWTVTIMNLETDTALMAHCKSKDDDLGAQMLAVGGKFAWNFKENFFVSTRFWCSFESTHGHATFDVFWPEKGTWLTSRCNFENCIWVAGDDGFYLKNIPTGALEFVHPWLPNELSS